MNVRSEDEHQAYLNDAQEIEKMQQQGLPPEEILAKISQAFDRHGNPKYKAHFLFMASTVLWNLGQKEAAYEVCLKCERLFHGTLFGIAAADRAKILFVEGGGRFKPSPTFVISVQVEPTNYCNLDCIMCSRNKKRKMGYMSMEMFKKIVDQVLAAGALGIRLYHMGEPLLHKSIAQLIDYFNQRVRDFGFRSPCMPRTIGMQTNGLMLDKDTAKRLMEAGLLDLSFSIDGRTPEEYEKIRNGAAYSRVIENLQNAGEIRERHGFKTRLGVSVVDMALEAEDRARLDSYYKRNGADTVSFMPCANVPGRHIVNKQGDVIPAEVGIEADPIDGGNPKKGKSTFTGQGDIDRIVVLWNGDIKLSCGEPSSASDIIGNIDDMSLMDAYRIKTGA